MLFLIHKSVIVNVKIFIPLKYETFKNEKNYEWMHVINPSFFFTLDFSLGFTLGFFDKTKANLVFYLRF